jgi:uncharacterized protein YabN with tetrapyrrole methylase and pyrophosphatase domain
LIIKLFFFYSLRFASFQIASISSKVASSISFPCSLIPFSTYINRLKKVEKGIKEQGKEIDDATLEEMDAIWNEAKRNE